MIGGKWSLLGCVILVLWLPTALQAQYFSRVDDFGVLSATSRKTFLVGDTIFSRVKTLCDTSFISCSGFAAFDLIGNLLNFNFYNGLSFGGDEGFLQDSVIAFSAISWDEDRQHYALWHYNWQQDTFYYRTELARFDSIRDVQISSIIPLPDSQQHLMTMQLVPWNHSSQLAWQTKVAILDSAFVELNQHTTDVTHQSTDAFKLCLDAVVDDTDNNIYGTNTFAAPGSVRRSGIVKANSNLEVEWAVDIGMETYGSLRSRPSMAIHPSGVLLAVAPIERSDSLITSILYSFTADGEMNWYLPFEMRWHVGMYWSDFADYKHYNGILVCANGDILLYGDYYYGRRINDIPQSVNYIFPIVSRFTADGELIYDRLLYDIGTSREPGKQQAAIYGLEELVDGGLLVSGRAVIPDPQRPDRFKSAHWLARLDELGCLYAGCEQDTNYLITHTEEISPQRVEIGEVLLYPNPSTGYIRLEIDGTFQEGLHLECYDGSGKRQALLPVNGSSNQYDIAHWPAGIYFWTLKKGHLPLQSGRLILQK